MAVTAVMYAGNAQSLKGLARDLLARRTLYQVEPFTKAVICVVPALVSSLRVVAGLQTAYLSSKYVTGFEKRDLIAQIMLLRYRHF